MSPSSAQRATAREQHKPSATHDWSLWVEVSDAARLMDISSGHLRRVCAEKLQPIAKAIYTAPPNGGNPRWFIHRSYDKRLAHGSQQAPVETSLLKQYTRKQIEDAFKRVACVEALREARQLESTPQRDWLPHLLKRLSEEHDMRISRTRLYAWDKAYTTTAHLEELIDKRGGDTSTSGDHDAWVYFRDIYLDERKPTKVECWKRTKDQAKLHGWNWCTRRTCQRLIDSKIPNEVQMQYREPAKWRNSMSNFIERNPEAYAAGQVWLGDHKQLDLWCDFNGRLLRPWLTAWMDWRTRRVVGFVLSDAPNSATILQALHAGLIDDRNMGGPSIVWIDNGKDYASFTFHGSTKKQRARVKEGKHRIEYAETQHQGLYRLLGIQPHFSLAYNPTGKARLERWFRNTDAFASSFTTYCGRKHEERPEYLQKLLTKERHKVPRFDHVLNRLAQYIDGENNRTDHKIDDLVDPDTRVRLSPDQALAKWCKTRRIMADPSALDMLMMHWSQPTTAQRRGIKIVVAGEPLYYGGNDPRLIPYKHQRKENRPTLFVAVNPEDVRYCHVFNDQHQPLFQLELNDQDLASGDEAIDRRHVAELNKAKRAYRNALKVKRSNYELEYLTSAELMSKIAADEREAAKGFGSTDDHEPNSQSMRIVQTPVDGYQEKSKRKAAGAEAFADLEDEDDSFDTNFSASTTNSNRSSDPFGDLEDDDDTFDMSAADTTGSEDDSFEDADVNVDDGDDMDVLSPLKFPMDDIEHDDDDDVHFLDLLQ